MEFLTSFVVEDNIDALQMLLNDLENYHKNIKVIGTASSVVDAAKALRKIEPDILFLDIMLGDGTGFDVLEIIPDIKSKIIFITASDEYAIKAFKFAAIDYILKPYDNTALAIAISRAKEQIQPQKEQIKVLNDIVKNPTHLPDRISLHTSEKIFIVDLEDIIRCKADNNYTTFYLNNNTKILVSKTLKYYSDLLKGNGFLRVHQSHLVNKKYIKEYIKSDGGYLLLKDNNTLPISTRKKAEIIGVLKD
ncbi:LytR/AlgR family response regulator transcription factor [Polaribacter porphyrae]|uniref:DNA-binding response regulator n=1 Tax=Polaribacter porphyrae TaxID=1137780 RepID=A0A2S7WLB3_9FLAO|nr:LytTR family DNA-binding domain-containing protein [Polaribacter porphyrae]PQJ78388.1 DNA-binding response regulator [Polaribacter porphyrae]